MPKSQIHHAVGDVVFHLYGSRPIHRRGLACNGQIRQGNDGHPSWSLQGHAHGEIEAHHQGATYQVSRVPGLIGFEEIPMNIWSTVMCSKSAAEFISSSTLILRASILNKLHLKLLANTNHGLANTGLRFEQTITSKNGANKQHLQGQQHTRLYVL